MIAALAPASESNRLLPTRAKIEVLRYTTLKLCWFLSDGAPEPYIAGKSFFCVEFHFLKFSSWARYKAHSLRKNQKKKTLP